MHRGDPAEDEDNLQPGVLDEWIEKTAEEQDISKAELSQQLLSSYWVIQELSKTLSENNRQRTLPAYSNTNDGIDSDSRETSENESRSALSDDSADTEEKNQQTVGKQDLLTLIFAVHSLATSAGSDSPQDSHEAKRDISEQVTESPEKKVLRHELNEIKQKLSELSFTVGHQDSQIRSSSDQVTSRNIVSKLDEINDNIDSLSQADAEQQIGSIESLDSVGAGR